MDKRRIRKTDPLAVELLSQNAYGMGACYSLLPSFFSSLSLSLLSLLSSLLSLVSSLFSLLSLLSLLSLSLSLLSLFYTRGLVGGTTGEPRGNFRALREIGAQDETGRGNRGELSRPAENRDTGTRCLTRTPTLVVGE